MSPRVSIQEIVVDCADPARLAEFWGTILECRWVVQSPDWAIVDADPLLVAFQRVPEPRTGPKNRLHLDVLVPDAAEAVERAVALGATRLRDPELTDGDGYVVMADPELNELCFVVDNHRGWRDAAQAALDAAWPAGPAISPSPGS